MANPTSNINIGGQLVDGSIATPDRKFRDAWTYDGKVVSIDPVGKAKIMGGLIKEECGKRIFAIADANTQMNLSAAAATGLLSAEDMDTFKAALGWVAAMRANVATLVGADDEDFADDAKWPTVPAGVAELAAKY